MIENQPSDRDDPERRIAPRIRTLKRARVLFNNRFSTIDCVVRNVSRTGALLTVDTAVHLPMSFEIRIGEDEARPAKLVYRREMFAGIRFLDVEPEEDLPDTVRAGFPAAEEEAPDEGEGIARVVHKPLPRTLVDCLPWAAFRRS